MVLGQNLFFGKISKVFLKTSEEKLLKANKSTFNLHKFLQLKEDKRSEHFDQKIIIEQPSKQNVNYQFKCFWPNQNVIINVHK